MIINRSIINSSARGVQGMKVAIVSDSHDRIDHLEWAIEEAHKRGAKRLFHCGDLISPFMVLTLAKFQGPVELIFGNNRGDVFLLCKLLKDYPQITLHGEEAFLEIEIPRIEEAPSTSTKKPSGAPQPQFVELQETLKIAMVHYPKIAEKLAKSGEFDFIFCGHTHKFRVWEVGKTLIINPGELMGKEGPPSFVVLDLKSREIEKIVLT